MEQLIKDWLTKVVKGLLTSKKANVALLGGGGLVALPSYLMSKGMMETPATIITAVLGLVIYGYLQAQGKQDQNKEAQALAFRQELIRGLFSRGLSQDQLQKVLSVSGFLEHEIQSIVGIKVEQAMPPQKPFVVAPTPQQAPPQGPPQQ